MKESIIAYNVIPTHGKLNQISIVENGQVINFATRINNRNSEKSRLTRNYAFRIDVEGGPEDILETLKTLHEYGISWKRNGEFYNDNPTNYLVFDFDALSETAMLVLQEYADKHKNECILFKSNSHNTKLDKRSLKLYHIVEGLETTEEAFSEAYDRITRVIFGWSFHEGDVKSGGIYETKADSAFSHNLFQVVYNHLNKHIDTTNIRYIRKNATYKFAITNLNQWDDDPNDPDYLPTENPRHDWKHEYDVETVSVFKYLNFHSHFPNCTVTDCIELGHIPNKEHMTKPFTLKECKNAKKLIVLQGDCSSQEVSVIRNNKPSNYGCIRNLEPKLDRKYMHVYKYLPVSWSDLCKEFKLHYYTTKVFAPYYGIGVFEQEVKKGIGGRHKRFLVPRIAQCISNLIVANHILRCNRIDFQFDLYAILANVKFYIKTRFDDLDDFYKDHNDEQLYEMIYKMYTNFSIREQLIRYIQDGGVCLRRNNLTEKNRAPYIQHINELLKGNWNKFNRRWFRSVVDTDSFFDDEDNTDALYKWIMANRNRLPSESTSQQENDEDEEPIKRKSKRSCLKGMSLTEFNQYCIDNSISDTNKRVLKNRYKITD